MGIYGIINILWESMESLIYFGNKLNHKYTLGIYEIINIIWENKESLIYFGKYEVLNILREYMES